RHSATAPLRHFPASHAPHLHRHRRRRAAAGRGEGLDQQRLGAAGRGQDQRRGRGQLQPSAACRGVDRHRRAAAHRRQVRLVLGRRRKVDELGPSV
ncbi:MAG: hypothetical protein ACK5QX_00620, partial [bacterium]